MATVLERLDERAAQEFGCLKGFEKEPPVWGTYSSRVDPETGVKAQNVQRTYRWYKAKITVCYDAATDEVYC